MNISNLGKMMIIIWWYKCIIWKHDRLTPSFKWNTRVLGNDIKWTESPVGGSVAALRIPLRSKSDITETNSSTARNMLNHQLWLESQIFHVWVYGKNVKEPVCFHSPGSHSCSSLPSARCRPSQAQSRMEQLEDTDKAIKLHQDRGRNLSSPADYLI